MGYREYASQLFEFIHKTFSAGVEEVKQSIKKKHRSKGMGNKSIKRRERGIEKKEYNLKKEKRKLKKRKKQLKNMRMDFENKKGICPICGGQTLDSECSECNMRKQALQDIIEIKRQLGDDALGDFDRAEMSLYGLRGTAACALLAAVYVLVYKCYYMIPVVVILGFLIAGYTQRINNIKRKWIGVFNKLELSEKFSIDDFMDGTIDKAEKRLKTGQADTLFEALS